MARSGFTRPPFSLEKPFASSRAGATPWAVGQLEQFAKETFANETEIITHGAIAWQSAIEIGLADVRLDGLLIVCNPRSFPSLTAPWSYAFEHSEVILEIKMPGDHLDFLTIERTLLRRQARQVQRMQHPEQPFLDDEPIWMVAPHVPAALRERRRVTRLDAGVYQVGPAWYSFIWIAANELPLEDELIPFLIARSGRSLDEFARWSPSRRPSQWVERMLQVLPVSPQTRNEVNMELIETDEPRIRENQAQMIKTWLRARPEVREEILTEGVEKGLEKSLTHQFERRLGRPLSDAERATFRQRLLSLGSDRLGDVVLDLTAADLATWLADPAAT